LFELDDERGRLPHRELPVMAGKYARFATPFCRPRRSNLDRSGHHPVGGDDVASKDPRKVDVLVPLNQRQREIPITN